jgi:uncharacterized protein (DUF362 family)
VVIRLRIGKVFVGQNGSGETFIDIVRGLKLRPPVVVKPNWGMSLCFTEAQVLDWLLSALDGDALVVESYGWARSEDALLGRGVGLKSRGALRRSDRWFLNHSGIGDVLEEHGVEYLNVTEEVWAGRVADPEEVKRLVESRYPPVHQEALLSRVPSRLHELRGGTFLSLAKLKTGAPPIGVSLSVKNLFGMIPGPGRMKFHGVKNSLLDESITDINKIYRAMFTVKGIVEAAFTASSEGKTPIEPVVHRDLGLVFGCEDTLLLDAFVTGLTGVDPHEVGHLSAAAEAFGPWDDRNVAQGRELGIRIFWSGHPFIDIQFRTRREVKGK